MFVAEPKIKWALFTRAHESQQDVWTAMIYMIFTNVNKSTSVHTVRYALSQISHVYLQQEQITHEPQNERTDLKVNKKSIRKLS